MPGTLYCLPNLIADGTLDAAIPPVVRQRACDVRYFLVEAAKTTRAYLKLLGHPGPIADLTIEEIGHDPDPAMIDRWLAPILAGEDAAVVSESGCPGIADPGAQLVARAQEAGIRVVPFVGPSSILMTLMASGLDGQRFRFLGYLPIHPDERREAVKGLEAESRRSETQLFIETPYRNNQMLASLLETLSPTTRVCVATDVTGEHESIRTLTVKAWKALAPEARELPKLPTVFAFLAAPTGEAPRYAPTAAHRKGEKTEKKLDTRPSFAGKTHRKPQAGKGPARAKRGGR